MYLLIVSYTQPPSSVEPHVSAHSQWVKKYLDEGLFLFAGPKTSGLGGVIGTKSLPKAKLQELLAEDSYVINDVADYQIVEFECKVTIPELESLKAY